MTKIIFHVIVSKAVYCVVSYLLFIVLSLQWLPFYIYKLLLALFVKCFVPNLDDMLPALETINSDEIISKPPISVIITVMEILGSPNISEIKKLFEGNVLEATLKPYGFPRYPTLKMYPVSFLGHSFWKQDSHFTLSNHIWEQDNKKCDGSLNKLCEYMVSFGFPENVSPWQLIIIRSADQEKYNLVFRMHHSLGDGKSVLKLLVECFGGKRLSTSEAVHKPMSLVNKAKYFAMYPIQMTNIALMLRNSEKEILHHPLNGLNNRIVTDQLFHVVVTEKISMRGIKAVAIRNKVKTSAVVISAITSAVNRFLVTLGNAATIENNLTLYMTLPKDGHPPTLVNHFNFGLSKAEINLQDRVESLQNCDQIYERLRSGDSSRYLMAFTNAIAAIPKPIRKLLTCSRVSTTGMTNVSGEREGFSVGGSECIDFFMFTSIPKCSVGASFNIMSYKEHLRVNVVTNATTLSQLETISLAKILEDEFLALIDS